MGNFLVNVTNFTTNNLKNNLKPSSFSWYAEHSIESNLDIVEVQRLWSRFIKLGGNENTGVWTLNDAKVSPYRISKSNIQLHLLSKLIAPNSRNLTFIEFINAIKWLKNSTTADKYQACYAIVNNNQPITKAILIEFLKSLFPSKNPTEIQNLINNLFNYIKTKTNSKKDVTSIEESQFVEYLQENLDPKLIESDFFVEIIPNSTTVNVNKNKESFGDNNYQDPFYKSTSKNVQSNYNTVPSDEALQDITRVIIRNISSSASKKRTDPTDPLSKLASILGLLPFDLAHLESIHRGDSYRVLLSVLREWRLREGARAVLNSLLRALHLAGLDQAVTDIQLMQQQSTKNNDDAIK